MAQDQDPLLSYMPSWASMTEPVPAHIPGDSIPNKEPAFPAGQATDGDTGGGGGSSGSGGATGSATTVWAMVVDPDTALTSFQTINALTV